MIDLDVVYRIRRAGASVFRARIGRVEHSLDLDDDGCGWRLRRGNRVIAADRTECPSWALSSLASATRRAAETVGLTCIASVTVRIDRGGGGA